MSKYTVNGKPLEFGNLEQIKFLKANEREVKERKEPMSDLLAIATIDAGLAILSISMEEYEKYKEGLTPLNAMIDLATGYDKSMKKNWLLQVEICCKDMIPCYRYLGCDEDVAFFKKVLKLTRKDLAKLKDIILPV